MSREQERLVWFIAALKGGPGEMDAWLEGADEADVRAAILAYSNSEPEPEGSRSGFGHVEAEGVMFGRMDSANFLADTITFRMEPGYYAAAGRYRIAPHAEQEPQP